GADDRASFGAGPCLEGRAGGRARGRARAPEAREAPGAAHAERATRPAEPPPRSELTEPRWRTDLAPTQRRRARDAIKRLGDAGAPDPEGMTRRDVAGDVPAIAAYAVRRRIDGLGPDAPPAAIVEALADGRDDDLGVRWRIVDGDGRPILIPRGASSLKRR